MSGEWLPPKAAADAEQPMLPLALDEHVELIRMSGAIAAFARRRVEQMLVFGHSAEADLDRPIDFLVREAEGRLRDVLDRTGRGRMTPPPEIYDLLKRKLEIAGALLIAAWERLEACPPDEPVND